MFFYYINKDIGMLYAGTQICAAILLFLENVQTEYIPLEMLAGESSMFKNIKLIENYLDF